MSDGKILHGQEYNLRKNLVIPFTEQQLDYTGHNERTTGAEGTASADITPTDVSAAKMREYDISGYVTAALAHPTITIAGYTRVGHLPAVLFSVTADFNGVAGEGAGNHPLSQMDASITADGSATLDPRSRAQASASIVPIATWDRQEYRNWVVPCVNHYFYLASPVTEAAILTKIGGGVVALPIFKPKERQLVLKGGQASVQSSADVSIAVGPESYSSEYGNDYSKEVGVNVRVDTIPESLHAGITIAANTADETVDVDVEVSTPALGAVGAITNTPATVSGTAEASVTFEGGAAIPATSPTDIPRTGVYLVEINGQVDDAGLVLVQAITVDMSVYA